MTGFVGHSRTVVELLMGGLGRTLLVISSFAGGLLLLDASFCGVEWMLTHDDRLLAEAGGFAEKAAASFVATALGYLWRQKLRRGRKVDPWAARGRWRAPVMLGHTTRRGDNRFDTLKILAAVAVLVSNAVPIAYGPTSAPPFTALNHGWIGLGTTAVLALSAISGYLVTQSFDRFPMPSRFIKARILRMFPALAVVITFSVGALGLSVTSLSFKEYLSHFDTSEYVYGGLSLIWMQYDLPGVFEGNPAGAVVNGSLWTLPCEFMMYLVVLVLGMNGLLNRRALLAFWLGALFLSWYAVGGAYGAIVATFLGGAVFYLWRNRVPLDWAAALLCAAALGLATVTSGFYFAFATFGVYLVVYFAFAPSSRFPDLARWGNLSYGIYIFAWPIQQTIVLILGPHMTWYWTAAISLPVVLGLAWLSWHFVERPALSLVRREISSWTTR